MTLSSSYLPPIDWFAHLVKGEPIFIEQWENFHKQTIRNRCTIDSPNGKLNLSIPVDKCNFTPQGKCLMKDVRISYHLDWQHQHWNALETTYFNSPFFEFLQDDFRPMYEKRWTFLMDFNELLIAKCCELLDIQPDIRRTDTWQGDTTEKDCQAHGTNSPLSPMNFRPYYQVFAHKHGFIPNLSIIDLIFNMGPEGILYLQSDN